MKTFGDAIARVGLAMAGRRSPWGGGDNEENPEPQGSGEPAGDGDSTPPRTPPQTPPASDEPGRGPRNPWLPGSEPAPPRRSASIEDIFRGGKRPNGGGPGGGKGGGKGGGPFNGLPPRANGKSWTPVIAGLLALVWVGMTSFHMLGPKEQGIVTTFGKFSRPIGSGVSMTLPWPIEQVKTAEVTSIKRNTIPEDEGENLVLTSDQQLIDLSYIVRWNIGRLDLFSFQLDDPQVTIREVAEAAMRASVAEVPLKDVMGGTGRGQIEQSVRDRMQAILDAYKSGVVIQGIDIKKADPPAKVISAFQKVTVAQQGAQQAKSEASGWAQQVLALAQGDAQAFDKMYEQYKLAPEVTRRRMYYETMESVLSANDKVVVEGNVTSYLPLPEVKRRAPENETVVTAPAKENP